jgi:Na+-driven multidrug efflux pump
VSKNDRPDIVARATVIAGVLTIVLDTTFVYRFSLIGAAIATVISYAVGAGIRI